jgi:hypothetical protein
MLLALIIVVVLGGLVAVGLVMDARSRRIRGHAGKAQAPDGEAGNREGLIATAELAKLGATAELATIEAGVPYIAEARATAERRPTAD